MKRREVHPAYLTTPRRKALARQGKRLAMAWVNGRYDEIWSELDALPVPEAIVVAIDVFFAIPDIEGAYPSGFLDALDRRVG